MPSAPGPRGPPLRINHRRVVRAAPPGLLPVPAAHLPVPAAPHAHNIRKLAVCSWVLWSRFCSRHLHLMSLNVCVKAVHAACTSLVGSRACRECAARYACSLIRTPVHSWARYMRGSHFPGWARPREFHARLLESMGRDEEARDNVRACPCWHMLGRQAAGLEALP